MVFVSLEFYGIVITSRVKVLQCSKIYNHFRKKYILK